MKIIIDNLNKSAHNSTGIKGVGSHLMSNLNYNFMCIFIYKSNMILNNYFKNN